MTNNEKSASVDLRRALLDPSAVFATPEAVLHDEGLSRQQKIEILRRWEYDASEICVAVEEGMRDGESDVLRRILLALGRLCDVDVEQVGPSKQHGLPSSPAESD